MSCAKGQPCEEGLYRRVALAMLGLMAVIFLALSAASFLPSRGQVVPSTVSYAGHQAVDGKRVFQAYNCMGCHTIVGNGAYFGPDLTKLYSHVGPAWLEAFIPSAGRWPTANAVKLQLQNEAVAREAGTDNLEAYLEKYPAAAERINRRGGQATLMPNLPLSREEIGKLIAFFKYTSEMDTEGWPPVPRVDGLTFPQAKSLPGKSLPGAALA
ncbi:MAG: c-type cytochrome, partial [Xanthobacteraceae bacterium]